MYEKTYYEQTAPTDFGRNHWARIIHNLASENTMNPTLIELMKDCGYWDKYKLDTRDYNFQVAMAKMHSFCASPKHKLDLSKHKK